MAKAKPIGALARDIYEVKNIVGNPQIYMMRPIMYRRRPSYWRQQIAATCGRTYK